MTHNQLPSLFIPHGGGPCFFMDWTRGPANTWDKMENWLANLLDTLPQRPAAIVIFSAHWEESTIHINSNPNPEMFFDYYGFPPHTYQLTFPAPGSPELASKIQALFKVAGINSELDPQHGFDHGTFVPLKVMLPNADIPVVQVSLHSSLDPKLHIEMGQALKSLRDENILILGSGMSFHNMQILNQGSDSHDHANVFNRWLNQASLAEPKERERLLTQWANAPSGIPSHPREEHLLPLMVAAGAAGKDLGHNIFTDNVMGATVSAFQFG